MQDFATRSLTISEETPEVAMELLTEDAEVLLVLDCLHFSSDMYVSKYVRK